MSGFIRMFILWFHLRASNVTLLFILLISLSLLSLHRNYPPLQTEFVAKKINTSSFARTWRQPSSKWLDSKSNHFKIFVNLCLFYCLTFLLSVLAQKTSPLLYYTFSCEKLCPLHTWSLSSYSFHTLPMTFELSIWHEVFNSNCYFLKSNFFPQTN